MRGAAAAGLALALTVALMAAGCGGGDDGAGGRETTLVLDFVPNGVHAGIYRAVAGGEYTREGIDLRVIKPGSSTDTLKLVASGRADFGIADSIDVASEVARGRDSRAVMALVQRPLGGLVTLRDEGIDSPRELEGRTVAVTGVPSDTAVLDTELTAAGGDPGQVDVQSVGFDTIPALLSGRADAITAFVPADATQIEAEGEATRSFPLDGFGGPRYPGLVVFASGRLIDSDPALVSGFVEATTAGYTEALRDPGAAVEAMTDQVPGLDPGLTRAQFDAYRPYFRVGGMRFGVIDPASIRSLSSFLVAQGLLGRPVSPAEFGTSGG